VGVGEDHTIGGVGVSTNAEPPAVVEPVMVRAQADQVERVGHTTVEPVDDVVHLEEMVRVASRDTAGGPVAAFDDSAGAFGHDPMGTADRHRKAVVEEDRRECAVAEQSGAQRVGDSVVAGVGGRGGGVDEQ
jgi:hypothetical protein